MHSNTAFPRSRSIASAILFRMQNNDLVKKRGEGLGLLLSGSLLKCLYVCMRVWIFRFRFKEKARHISSLMRYRRRPPLELAGDWIEYVIRHSGARHLRPQVFNIPWYQYYLLDVMAFLVAMVTMVALVVTLMCKCLCRLFRPRSNNSSKTKDD